uniref:ATP-binding protein n=1 Tax=Methylomarinum vadi TaxID=438855 RepID=UPI00190F7F6F
MPHIFDRFYQLDNNRTVEKGYSGLGLDIVKLIVELHQSIIMRTTRYYFVQDKS